MENRTTRDNAFDITDSTDWLGTPLSALMPVEQAFRCHVCKDFYTSPMITSCNHTFCSLCIRRCLSLDGNCPLCRTSDQESKLRGNWALREAVDAFVKSRPAIMLAARTQQGPDNTVLASPKRKAGQMESMKDMEDIQNENATNPSKRTRMSTRSSKTKAAEATAAIMREEVDVPESKTDSMNYGLGRLCNTSSLVAQGLMGPGTDLAACPICWARMKSWQVDKHIDTSCPGSPQPAAANKVLSRGALGGLGSGGFSAGRAAEPSAPAKPMERLPVLNYSILKDQALRKRMSDLGISTSGPRPLLERRHREWVTIWNANCDSFRPKKRSEMLQDLEFWEWTLGGHAPMTHSTQLGAQIRDKDFDGTAWATKHDTSFKDLIANARRTRNEAVTRNEAGQRPQEDTQSNRASGERSGMASAPQEEGDEMPPAGTNTIIDLTGDPSHPAELPYPTTIDGVTHEQDAVTQTAGSANPEPSGSFV